MTLRDIWLVNLYEIIAPMLRNYLLVFLRKTLRRKAFAAINIASWRLLYQHRSPGI